MTQRALQLETGSTAQKNSARRGLSQDPEDAAPAGPLSLALPMLGQEEGFTWWKGRQTPYPPGAGHPLLRAGGTCAPPRRAGEFGNGESGSQRRGSPDSESFSSQSM